MKNRLLKDKDFMNLKVYGDNPVVFEKLLCRVSKELRLEVHIDTDEGNACDLGPDSLCELVNCP